MIANKHTTLFDGGVANQITTPLQVVADDDTQEVQLLNLYPDIRYQTIDGFGGAITEAAGSVLRQMPEETVEKILQGYFGAEGCGTTLFGLILTAAISRWEIILR